MCVVINPDIVVGSKISDYWAYLNLIETDSEKKLDKMLEFSVSIKECMKKQALSKRMGLGNVVAVSTEKDYKDFIERSGLFVWADGDKYLIKKECKSLLPTTTKINKTSADIKPLLQRVVTTIYTYKLLTAFHII